MNRTGSKNPRARQRLLFVISLLVLAGGAQSACAQSAVAATGGAEEGLSFRSGSNTLRGLLTLPEGVGPFPAIVLVSGSGDPSTGIRDGVASPLHVEHARMLVRDGYAILRYDPPGVGGSTGMPGFESLESRVEEAMGALRALQSHPAVRADRIGFLANSQGAWVIQMAAAKYPRDVAFIITLSGSGVSVAEQQVYGIEMQSRAGGLTEEDVGKAVAFGRLLVDWQLDRPMFRDAEPGDASRPAEGVLRRFRDLVYEPRGRDAAAAFGEGLAILREAEDETWARYLYLRMVVAQLETIPPEQVSLLKREAEKSLRTDPKDFLVDVHCPVLAFLSTRPDGSLFIGPLENLHVDGVFFHRRQVCH